MNKNLNKNFNEYGTLVTVTSLILIVVYSSGSYDGWDALIGVVGLCYGATYLLKKVFFDRASQL